MMQDSQKEKSANLEEKIEIKKSNPLVTCLKIVVRTLEALIPIHGDKKIYQIHKEVTGWPYKLKYGKDVELSENLKQKVIAKTVVTCAFKYATLIYLAADIIDKLS